MLIRNAELDFGARSADVRLTRGRIESVTPELEPQPGEEVLDAHSCALLPSLHDTHIHLYALAAAQASVACGPPGIGNVVALAAALGAADARLPVGEWLRGVGFHESVMVGCTGGLTRDWLDAVLPARPVRIQHRSGRLWVMNSMALTRLGVRDADAHHPLERVADRLTGRLYDADGWLRLRLGSTRPSLATVSRELWAKGVTMVTDASVGNSLEDYRAFARAQASGELLQDVQMMGSAELDAAQDGIHGGRRLWRGPRKFHLHEHDLPEFDVLRGGIRAAHAAGRAAAFHCVTRAELVFALAALRSVGVCDGDRIEHASVTPPEALAEIAALGLAVSTQSGFILARGDEYLRDVASDDQAWLYRARSFVDAGVSLALSSDAPFGPSNPWQVAAAAVARKTPGGVTLGAEERLTPEQALTCLTHSYDSLSAQPRRVVQGGPAALMLLPAPWQEARTTLTDCHPLRVWGRELLLPR